MGKRLFVGNLPYAVDAAALREHFAAVGEVVDASIVLDKETQRSRGFGFVEMATEEAAAAAISGLNESELGRRSIQVKEAHARQARRSGGGGGTRNAWADDERRGGGRRRDRDW